MLKWLADEKRAEGPNGVIGFSISADMSREGLRRRAPERVGAARGSRIRDGPRYGGGARAGQLPEDDPALRYVAVKFVKKQLELDGTSIVKHLAIVSNRRDLTPAGLMSVHRHGGWLAPSRPSRGAPRDEERVACRHSAEPPIRCERRVVSLRRADLQRGLALKQLALPPPFETARPKRLRFALFTLAARITSHAGALVMKIGRAAAGLADLVGTRARIVALGAA